MNTNCVSDKRERLISSLRAVPACQTRDEDADWFPALDVTETAQEYVVEVDLPGLKPEEIQMHVDSDGLSITGQRAPRHQGGKNVRLERPSGAFIRQLPWPQDAEGEILATFCDGVLELRVPRSRPRNGDTQARAVAPAPEEVAP